MINLKAEYDLGHWEAFREFAMFCINQRRYEIDLQSRELIVRGLLQIPDIRTAKKFLSHFPTPHDTYFLGLFDIIAKGSISSKNRNHTTDSFRELHVMARESMALGHVHMAIRIRKEILEQDLGDREEKIINLYNLGSHYYEIQNIVEAKHVNLLAQDLSQNSERLSVDTKYLHHIWDVELGNATPNLDLIQSISKKHVAERSLDEKVYLAIAASIGSSEYSIILPDKIKKRWSTNEIRNFWTHCCSLEPGLGRRLILNHLEVLRTILRNMKNLDYRNLRSRIASECIRLGTFEDRISFERWVLPHHQSRTKSHQPQISPTEKLFLFLKDSEIHRGQKEIFEHVWNLAYKPEQHRNLVDVTLGRLRKILLKSSDWILQEIQEDTIRFRVRSRKYQEEDQRTKISLTSKLLGDRRK